VKRPAIPNRSDGFVIVASADMPRAWTTHHPSLARQDLQGGTSGANA
jgi:hypothetical protein